jgi:phosphate transport system substrate-binding protein
MSLKRYTVIVTLLILYSSLVLWSAETSNREPRTITIKGSDTMLILGQKWAEVYMKENPGIKIQISGGGSGVGFSALINGTTHIAEASRHMEKEEEETLIKERGESHKPIEFRVAMDGITIYVNEDNPVDRLTFDQLRDIYLGKIRNWKEVGGQDAKIVMYGRESASGTRRYFQGIILNMADFALQVQPLPGTGAIVNAVANDKNGIGYGGVGYARGVKKIKIARDEKSGYYPPEREYVVTGQYPLARHLYWYTAGPPKDEVKKLLDWVLGPEGQNIVEEVGYFPVVK